MRPCWTCWGLAAFARFLIVVEDRRAAVIYDPLRFYFFFYPRQAHRFKKNGQTFSHKRTSQTLWGEESVRRSLNLPCIWSELMASGRNGCCALEAHCLCLVCGEGRCASVGGMCPFLLEIKQRPEVSTRGGGGGACRDPPA